MNTSQIRIAILYDKPLNQGGVETHLRSIFRCSDPTRYHFLIIAPEAGAFTDLLDQGRVEFEKFEGWWPLRWKNFHQLLNILQNHHIDFLHAHSSTAAILGRIAAKIKHLPVIDTVHLPVTEYHGTLTTLRARTGRFLFTEIDRVLNFTSTDQIIFVSQKYRADCIIQKLVPANKSILIPNGIDLTLYHPKKNIDELRQHFGVAQDAFILTFVGRLDHQKGVEQLLAAYRQLSPKRLRCLLWIIGDGPLRMELETSASFQDSDKQVIFWGYQKSVSDFLFASDLFVLPSLYEAMPITLLEALAAGLPCVATDVGDNRQIIEPEINGLIVPSGDSEALKDALEHLMADPALRQEMSVKNSIKIIDFDERFMVERLQVIYNKFVSKYSQIRI